MGDIFNWFVDVLRPDAKDHDSLTVEAASFAPGASGLLALDWHNGNRTVLVDQRLTGGILGLTLHSSPSEIYRALLEATALGARVIVERLEAYGVAVDRIVNCGGISVKNRLVMECFREKGIDPLEIPGVLVAGHGPFAWGKTLHEAVENAIVLEAVARMALHTCLINPEVRSIEQVLLDKHFLRKHGTDAYYGQR